MSKSPNAYLSVQSIFKLYEATYFSINKIPTVVYSKCQTEVVRCVLSYKLCVWCECIHEYVITMLSWCLYITMPGKAQKTRTTDNVNQFVKCTLKRAKGQLIHVTFMDVFQIIFLTFSHQSIFLCYFIGSNGSIFNQITLLLLKI